MPTNKAQALYDFFSSFGWAAYDENTVPDDAPLPYITFEVATNGFDDGSLSLSASLWSRSTSWQTVEEKAAEIAGAINDGGLLVSYDGGALWVKRGTPFTQRMNEPNDTSIRRIVLNIETEYFS